jgi:hypothetical protein
VHTLYAIVVILSGLVAGGALNNALAMGPALRTLDEQTLSEVQRHWSPLPARYSALASVAAGLAGVALLVFGDLRPAAEALVAAAIGLGVLLLVSIEATRRMELTARGAGAAPRTGDVAMVRRWHAAQAVAAVASLGVLACYSVAGGPVS